MGRIGYIMAVNLQEKMIVSIPPLSPQRRCRSSTEKRPSSTLMWQAIRLCRVATEEEDSQYGIQSAPTLMLFRQGEVLWKTIGGVQRTELVATIYFVFLLLARDSSSKLGSPLARSWVDPFLR